MSTVLKDLADGARNLQRIKKELSDVQFQEEILNLRQLLISAQTEIIEKNQKISDLTGELSEARLVLKFADQLRTVKGFKFEIRDGEPFGLPFCPTCETNHGKFFRLVPPGGENRQHLQGARKQTMPKL